MTTILSAGGYLAEADFRKAGAPQSPAVSSYSFVYSNPATVTNLRHIGKDVVIRSKPA